MDPSAIILSNIDWDFNYQRHQAVAEILCQSRKVYYFNPYKTLAGNWRFPSLARMNRNLYIIDFLPLIPCENRSQFIKQINRSIYAIFVGLFSFCVKLLSGKKAILYQFLPRGCAMDNRFFQTVFCDMVDLLPGDFPGLAEQESYDLSIMRKADHRIITARGIGEMFGDHSAEVIPNGIFSNKYVPVFNYNMLRWKMGGYKIRTIGYVGGTHEVDFEFLEELVTEFKDFRFLVIGPVDRAHSIKQDNVTFTGQVRHGEVLNYLKCIDLGLVPFRINRVTRNVDAIKIYEFFASGIPVISTEYSNTIPEEVFLIRNIQDVKLGIAELETVNNQQGSFLDLSVRLRRFAIQSDWNNRFAGMLSQSKPGMK